MIVSFVQRPSGLLQSGTFQLRTRGILQNPCQVEKNEAVHAKKTVCETGMAAGGSRRGENSKEFFGKRRARLRESRAIPRKAGHFWGKPGAAGDDAGQYRGKTGRGRGNRAPQCTGSSRRQLQRGEFQGIFWEKRARLRENRHLNAQAAAARQKKRGLLTQHGETAPCPAGPF